MRSSRIRILTLSVTFYEVAGEQNHQRKFGREKGCSIAYRVTILSIYLTPSFQFQPLVQFQPILPIQAPDRTDIQEHDWNHHRGAVRRAVKSKSSVKAGSKPSGIQLQLYVTATST